MAEKKRKRGRPRKKPIVIERQPEVCSNCGGLDTLRTYKTKKSHFLITRYRECTACNQAYYEKTEL